jgi:ferredoxin-thioredoxin reductase catalytic subunit
MKEYVITDKSLAMGVEMVHRNRLPGTVVNPDAKAVRQKVKALLTHAGECQYAIGEVCPCQRYREEGECGWQLYQRKW